MSSQNFKNIVEDSDIFDVLACIAFALALQSRKERVSTRKENIFAHYGSKEQQFLARCYN